MRQASIGIAWQARTLLALGCAQIPLLRTYLATLDPYLLQAAAHPTLNRRAGFSPLTII